MNSLSSLTYRVGELRKAIGDRLTSDVKDFINRAQRYICERNDFSFMRSHEDVTIPSGSTTAPLAENFKQLTQERSPVSFTDSSTTAGAPMPVRVYSREEMQRRGWWPLRQWVAGTATYLPGFGIFIDYDQNIPTLNIPQNVTTSASLTFTVSAFYYLPDLQKATDHNALTDNGLLSDALVNLAKAMAYEAEDPTNEMAAASRALFESAYKSAMYADVRKTYAGRSLRA